MADITDRDREAFHNGPNSYQSNQTQVKNTSSTTFSIAKVFLYMFIGLLITALVAFGVGALVYYQVVVEGNGSITTPYLIAVITSVILLFVDMLVITFVTLKGKHSILVPAIIYAVLIGVVFSMLTIVVDWRLIGMAFGITSLIFLIMSLIAFITKGNLAPLMIGAIGLFLGAGLLALFNWLFMLFTGTGFSILYWVVTFAIFAVIMIIALVDLWRIKKIAEAGAMSNNLALYCAFTMYVDFISIFLRVLYFLIIIFARRN